MPVRDTDTITVLILLHQTNGMTTWRTGSLASNMNGILQYVDLLIEGTGPVVNT